MKRALLFAVGVILGATMAAVPFAYKLQRTIEEKQAAVNMATNLVQSEPAAIEAACHQREATAQTAAIAEITSQFKSAPAPSAAPPPPAGGILAGLLRLILR